MRVVFFTAGSHGAGHLVRAAALLRALARSGIDNVTVDVVAPSSSAFLRLVGDAGHAVEIDAAALRAPATAASSDVATTIARLKPDLVVIDVFWVPLVFVPLRCPAWLLLRSVPPAWLVGPKEARFDPARYERIFAIEPAPGLERYEAIDPVVVAGPDDGLPRTALAQRLGVDVKQPLQVIVRGGLPSDGDVLTAAARSLNDGPWHSFDLHQLDAPFPVAPLLVHADRIVAAPGYNTFWESRLLDFDDRVHWVPIKRTLDDANWRARLPTSMRPTRNGADTLAQLLIERARR